MKRGPAALALALGSSCARNPEPASGDPAAPPVTVLHVDNQSLFDMDIFVVGEAGNRMRIGFVTNHNTADLRIPSIFLLSVTQLRFVADPVGSRPRSASEEITVAPGDTV